ncbi:MAG: ABC transporter ATP-binding protein, partial [Pseudomonadota bacterium]
MISVAKQKIRDRMGFLVVNAGWTLKTAWQTSGPFLVGILCCELFVSATPAAIAWAGRCLINAIAQEAGKSSHNFSGILTWLIISLSLVLASELFGTFSKFFKRHLNEKLGLKVEMDLLKHSSELDISLFEDPEFQDVAMRAKQNSADNITGFLNKVILLGSNICKIAGLVAILFIIDPLIVLVITPLVVPFVFFKWSQAKRRFNKEYTRATKRRWTNYYSSLLTDRNMVSEVKLFNLAPGLIEKFRQLKLKFIREDKQIYQREFIGTFVFSTLFAILFYFLFARIAIHVMDGSLTIGDITIFAGATKELFNLLSALATQVSDIMEGMLFVENLMVFFRTSPRIVNRGSRTILNGRGEFEFRNVWFKYPGSESYALKDISFRLSPGKSVAIIGRNGAGKSTIVKLMARFYEPDRGEILLDSTNINQLPMEEIHKQIAFVFQNPNRYEAT